MTSIKLGDDSYSVARAIINAQERVSKAEAQGHKVRSEAEARYWDLLTLKEARNLYREAQTEDEQTNISAIDNGIMAIVNEIIESTRSDPTS